MRCIALELLFSGTVDFFFLQLEVVKVFNSEKGFDFEVKQGVNTLHSHTKKNLLINHPMGRATSPKSHLSHHKTILSPVVRVVEA